MFPEIRGALKKVLSRSEDGPLSLNLKGSFSYGSNPADAYYRDGFEGIGNTLSAAGWGAPAWSGETVNIHTAHNLSAVWACRRIICETVGALPCVMMQRSGKGDQQDASDKPLYQALKIAPNAEMSAMAYTETATGHAVMRGTSFSNIIRRSGTGVAMELYPIHPDRVRRDRDKAGKLVWVVDRDRSYTVDSSKPHDILTMPGLSDDGIQGYSVIQVARQSMGTALAAERNVGNFYAHGGRMPFVLTAAEKWATKSDADKFRFEFETEYNDPHRAPMLPPNFKWDQIGLSLKDQQMLESRQWSVTEICRWFGVQPHLIFDLSRSTNNNIEQQALEFLKFTLAPWLTRWEQNLWRCVLTPAEKAQGYYFRHNVDALLRGDFTTRMNGYATMLQNGVLSIDDVLSLEDSNPVADGAGKARHIQVNMQTLPGTGEPLQPAQASESPNAKPINQPRAA